jgi:signal transduction histidine kinase
MVLAAWHTATLRLERTHESLCGEVARLTKELEIKNRELARKNRLADLGQMAAHVAHEVRNNLVPVSLYMSLLRRRLSGDSGSQDILAKIEAGFIALDATVNDLLNFTAHRQPQWQTFLVGDLVSEVCDSLEPQLQAQMIDVDIDVPPNTLLTADRELIRRALVNLVLNAVDAMRDGGSLVITSYDHPRGFELEVADSGPGLSDEAKRRAFEPFYSTKQNGTGLGLALVQHVAEAHGGTVTAANCPEGGAAFTIKIPRRAMRAAA